MILLSAFGLTALSLVGASIASCHLEIYRKEKLHRERMERLGQIYR